MDKDSLFTRAARTLLCSKRKLEGMFVVLTTPDGDFLVERRLVMAAKARQEAALVQPVKSSIITPEQFMQEASL